MRRWKAKQPGSSNLKIDTLKGEAYRMGGKAYDIPYTPGMQSWSCLKMVFLQLSYQGRIRYCLLYT